MWEQEWIQLHLDSLPLPFKEFRKQGGPLCSAPLTPKQTSPMGVTLKECARANQFETVSQSPALILSLFVQLCSHNLTNQYDWAAVDSAQQHTTDEQSIEAHKSFANSMIIPSMLFSLISTVINCNKFQILKSYPVLYVGEREEEGCYC